jgi:long-chain fatty acid transport protein
MWKITDKLTLDAGVSDTFYQDEKVNFSDPVVPSYDDVYGKTTLSFAAGISYSIF